MLIFWPSWLIVGERLSRRHSLHQKFLGLLGTTGFPKKPTQIPLGLRQPAAVFRFFEFLVVYGLEDGDRLGEIGLGWLHLSQCVADIPKTTETFSQVGLQASLFRLLLKESFVKFFRLDQEFLA